MDSSYPSFSVQCPVKPAAVPKKGVTDVSNETDSPLVDGQDMSIDFAVSPGSSWVAMKKYRNVKCQLYETLVYIYPANAC